MNKISGFWSKTLNKKIDFRFYSNINPDKTVWEMLFNAAKEIEKEIDAIIDIKYSYQSYELLGGRPNIYTGTAIKFIDDNIDTNKKTINLSKDKFMKQSVVKNFMYNAEEYDARLEKFDNKNFEIRIKGKIK